MKRAFLLVILCAASATAQELFPRFSVGAGVQFADFATDIRADIHESEGTPLVGTDISLERDLGLDPKEELNRFTLQWRPFNRHELSATYFSTSRHGLLAIERSIRFEDSVYPVRAEVATDLAIDYWQLSYTGWLRKSERDGFGLTLAVLALSVEASLTGRLPDFSQSITESVSTMAPLAMIGAQGRFAVTPRVVVEASVVTLPRVKFDVYSGRAVVARGLLEYRVTRNLGVGAAYNYFDLDGTFDDPDYSGRLDLIVEGVEAHVRYVFGR